MPVTPEQPERSEAQGALAGLLATLAGVPMLGVALVIALVLQRTVLQKVMHQDVEFSEMRWGSMAIMANIVLAVLTGFFAALLSGMLAIKLVSRAATRGFVAVAGLGSLLIALGVYRWLLPHANGHSVSLGLLIGFGWVAALAGLYAPAGLRDVD